MTDVEKQYARALFSLALEKNEVDNVYQEMFAFLQSTDLKTKEFFLHPKIAKKDKHEIIEKTLTNNLLVNFLKVLIDNDRFILLDNIVYAYLDLINEMNEVVEVKITTNTSLSKNNIEKIKKNLETKLLKKIKIIEELDETIIGGIRIEYLGNVIDETVNSSLENMKQSFLGGNKP
ncbi:MAG: ATP synthase F1 subunit delta [Candidatus Izemoplasmatales bacterium]